jgi:DNA repair protein RadD
MYQLRDYQLEPVHKGIQYLRGKSKKPSIIVAPTAFGKSLLIAAIAKELGEGVVVLQPSMELLEQNYQKYVALGGEATIYSASAGQKKLGKVTYATLGSIKNLGASFKAYGYRCLIIDELHLYPRTMDSMLGKFLEDSGVQKVLGLTATPFKLQQNVDYDSGESYSKLVMLTSRSKHGNFFKEVLHVTQIKEMAEKGYWSKLLYDEYDFDTRKLKYNSSKAEYTEESILKQYEQQHVSDKIVECLYSLRDRKSILVFVPSVAEAIRLASQTTSSAAVYGDMPTEERQRVIHAFKNGKLRIIFNVNVLSVGFDHPLVDAILLGRPTASLAWYYQVLGRGTRVHEDKKDCLIVDFVRNVEKFGRIEDFYFTYEDNQWKLLGTGGKLLTGIPLHEIGQESKPSKTSVEQAPILGFGKFKGQHLRDTPEWYRKWLLQNFEFTTKTQHLKTALLRLKENPKAFEDVEKPIECTSMIGGKLKVPFYQKQKAEPRPQPPTGYSQWVWGTGEDDLPF